MSAVITKSEAQMNLLDAEDLISSVLESPRLLKVEYFHSLKVIQKEIQRIRREI